MGRHMRSVLVGDIGGTNTRFGIAHRDAAGHVAIESYLKHPGDDFPTLMEAIESYLSGTEETPDAVSLAVAGPIQEGQVRLTNRDWQISEDEICTLPGIASAKLFNDFAAMARSAPEMNAQDFDVVHDGIANQEAPILVAGPGTGFGVGYVVPIGESWRVLNTEGGHVAYAPQTEIEAEILAILQKSYDYVSVELVASGSGLIPVHKAVCQRHRVDYVPLPPADIKHLAERGDIICQEVCDIRSAATMGALGDLVLSGGARGGVVIAGGVAERMIDQYRKPEAMARFFDKGARKNYLKDIPIRLLTNHLAPLIGAAALFMDTHNV